MVKEIKAVLKLDGKEFKTAAEEAKAVTVGLSSAITASAAAVAIAMKVTANYEDSLTKLSRSAGLTVQSMSELAHAADLSGIKHEELAKSMRILAAPSAAVRAEFSKLGVTLQANDGKLKTQDQLLGDIADKFKGMKSSTDRAETALKIFGEEGAKMVNMLKDGSAGLQAMRDEAVAMGIAFSREAGENAEKLNDDLSKVGKSIQGVTMSVSNSIIAFVNQSGILDMVAKAVQKVTALWNGLDDETKDMIITVGAIVAGIAGIITIAAGLSAVAPMIMGIVGSLSMVTVGILAGVAAVILFGVTMVKYWGQIKGSIEPVLDLFKSIGKEAVKNLEPLQKQVQSMVKDIGLETVVKKFDDLTSSIKPAGTEISVLGTIAKTILSMIATTVLMVIAPFEILHKTISGIIDSILMLGDVQKMAAEGGDEGLKSGLLKLWDTIKEKADDVAKTATNAKKRIEDTWKDPLVFVPIDTSKARKAIEDIQNRATGTGKPFFAGIYEDWNSAAIAIEKSKAMEAVLKGKLDYMAEYGKSMGAKQKAAYEKVIESVREQANSLLIVVIEKISAVVAKVAHLMGAALNPISGLVQNFNVGIQRSMEETSRSMQIAQIKYTEQMQATIEATQKAEEEKAAALEAQYDKQIEDLKNAEERKLGIIENASAERLLALNNEYLEAKRIQEEAFAAYLEQEYAKFEAEKALLEEKSVDKEQRQLAGQVMDEDWRLYEEQLQAEQQAKLEALQQQFTTKQKAVDDKAKADKVATAATTKAQLELLEKQKSEALQKLEAEKNAKLEALEKEKAATEKQMKKDEAAMKWKAESAMLENMKPIKVAETMTQAIGSAAQAFGSMAYLGPVGLGIGAGLAALIMANAAYSVSNILSQKAPKPIELSLGSGGVISGPSHAQGGVAARIEGGEGVIDRARTEKLLDAVDSASAAGRGGVSIIFEAGSIQNNGKELDESFMDQLSYALARRMERMGYA